MPRLILIRHSDSQPVVGEPSHAWDLSEDGKRRAALLAEAVAELSPASLHTSVEPKATSTAEFISRQTGLAVNIDPRFNEQERSAEAWRGEDEFKQAVSSALREPGELLFGSETVETAVKRFKAAVADGEKYCPPGDMAIVSHGTVISGFVAWHTGVDPVSAWESLGMPGLVVIKWPDPDGIELQRNIEG